LREKIPLVIRKRGEKRKILKTNNNTYLDMRVAVSGILAIISNSAFKTLINLFASFSLMGAISLPVCIATVRLIMVAVGKKDAAPNTQTNAILNQKSGSCE
jgi:hypothetical protein